jgi:hypothetical protein
MSGWIVGADVPVEHGLHLFGAGEFAAIGFSQPRQDFLHLGLGVPGFHRGIPPRRG